MPSPKRRNISQRSEMIYDAHNFGILIDTREIFVAPNLNESLEDSSIDHVVAHQFVRNLSILNNMGNEIIVIHMLTCGGEWDYGMAMYDAIRNSCDDDSLSDIVTVSYAGASSMSSIIPQAAKWRVIMPNAYFHVHYGEYGDSGNYTNFMSGVQWQQLCTEVMIDIYTNRIQGGNFFKDKDWGPNRVRQWLKDTLDKRQEVYMTARESVEKGFMDAVLGDPGFETLNRLRDE